MVRLVLLVLASFSLAAQDSLLIRNATLIDGTGAPPRVGDVRMRDGKIVEVGTGLSGGTVIDGAGKTLLPGFFDLHIHVGASAVSGIGGDWLKHLMAYSWSGVTTVADLGAYPEMYEPVRKLLAERLWAPRLMQAARFSSPGGHGLEGGRGDFHTQAVQTPREARAAVKRIAPYKPDLLKVFSDGWRYGLDTDMTSMDEATLTALVDEAHKNGLKVVTHTVSLEKGKWAARAGVDIIVHGLGDAVVDDEWIGLMKAKGTAYVQTLSVYEPRRGADARPALLDTLLEPAARQLLRPVTTAIPAARQRRWLRLMENGKRAFDGGVLLGAGTDAGMPGAFHGWASLHEMELMVQGGLTPLQALTAATGGSARAVGVDGQRGFLRAGLAADLVLINGKPHENIRDVFKPERVWIGGKEVDRAALAKQIATDGPTPLESVKLPSLLDDFESGNGRSRLDTLWLNATDGGHDHAEMSYQRTQRKPGQHALTVLVEAGEKEASFGSMVLPLTRAAVLPAAVDGYRGIEFELRGAGPVEVIAQSRARDRKYPRAQLSAAAQWKKTRVEFKSMGAPVKELTALEFRLARPAGEKAWFEIDNVRLYR